MYQDLPRMTQEAWDIIIAIIEEDNVELLRFAEYPDKEHGTAVRGQIMISPKGIQNLKDHAKGAKP